MPTLSVSQLNRQVRSLLESHFDFVWVNGEVSNFAAPSSGHWYFTLKDGDAQVRCAMFRNRNQRLRFRPQNGDAVRVRCRVSLYEGRGEFQLIGEFMELSGAGALQAAFEQLKRKLAQEGLFEQALKQPLPTAPKRLGIVTSPTGAAIHDMLTVLARRSPGTEVYLLPVAVQGEGAAGQISRALEQANRWAANGEVPLDALIVGRGGGSLEDLWAFNEEVVARAIAASALPVVSAVGHEVDFSIADLVADQRAPTPSAAAELLSVDSSHSLAQLKAAEAGLSQAVGRLIARQSSELSHLSKRLQHPGHQLREQSQRLDNLEMRLLGAHNAQQQRCQHRLQVLQQRLRGRNPAPRIQQQRQRLGQDWQKLRSAIDAVLQTRRTQSTHLGQLLDSLSPLKVLERGYGIVRDEQGQVIKDAAQVTVGDEVSAQLHSGELALTVTGSKAAT